MLGKHAFCVFLALSTLGHVAGITSLKVLVGPSGRGLFHPGNVSFLGAFFGDVVVLGVESSSIIQAEAWRNDPRYHDSQILVKPQATQGDVLTPEGDSKPFVDRGDQSKKVPRGSDKNRVKFPYSRLPDEVQLQGDAARRDVLYMPPTPKLPRWVRAFGADFSAVFTFVVTPEGYVKKVSVTYSSGYPEIDAIGIRYLMGIKFVPLLAEYKQEESLGSVRLIFIDE